MIHAQHGGKVLKCYVRVMVAGNFRTCFHVSERVGGEEIDASALSQYITLIGKMSGRAKRIRRHHGLCLDV